MQAEVQGLLEKQGYRIIGGHSAVKICHWAKEKLVHNRSCYKAKFYGIASHRCLQMTPSVIWCEHQCLFCWRPMEYMHGPKMKVVEYSEPHIIVEESLKHQRQLLSGFWGDSRVNLEDMKEADAPKHTAISLAGEPTAYPYIDELIHAYHRRGFTTFLVTNGQNPKALEKCEPTQLYISLIAYDPALYKKINVPLYKDGWERLNQSLEVMRDKKGRKALRITLVKGFNLEAPEKFVKLVLKADPDYIEPKGYVHVGYSRKRLTREHMPTYEEVMEFGRMLGEEINYEITNSTKASKVALLTKKR
ncbi:MAG: 4-demethylwyosine synthase TYW1 [Candidatus Hydrothermarchaeota archaeon]|nr:4-demethylwyosine synthase TYW1 [Candidatus Hydrothermarchaeota archaeon]